MSVPFFLRIDHRAFRSWIADDEQRIQWCYLNLDANVFEQVRTIEAGLRDAAKKFNGTFKKVWVDWDKLHSVLAFEFGTDEDAEKFSIPARQLAVYVEGLWFGEPAAPREGE